MDDLELESLFRDLESDRVERKASDADRNKIRQAVCAFANDLPNYRKPGVIFVGVKDDGYGIPTAKRALKKNGNPPAEFSLNDAYTSVVIKRRA